MELETAFTATESRTFTVPFVGMPAVRALLRSVSGIHKQNVLSKSFSLITDKLLKLVERPVIELAVELFTSSLLNSDLAQIFKSKYSVFRVHNLLRYAMVHVSHKPSFPAGQTLKLAFSRTGAFGLQLFTKVGITSAPIFDLLRIVKRVIRADCNIHYPTIYSKDHTIFSLLRIAMLKRYMQIENFVSTIIRDCRRLDSPTEIISVMRWYIEGGFDSSVGTSNRGYAVDQVHGDNSLIIPHRSERLAFWKLFTFDGFQSFASAISCSLNQGRRKTWNALTSKLVSCTMGFDFVPRLVLISPFRGNRKCFAVSSHSIEKSLAILVSQPELECYRPKHVIYVGDWNVYTLLSAYER